MAHKTIALTTELREQMHVIMGGAVADDVKLTPAIWNGRLRCGAARLRFGTDACDVELPPAMCSCHLRCGAVAYEAYAAYALETDF